MFDIDRWTEIWVTITRNKTRSLMTCFGVFWGILMLVLLLGTGSGFKNAMFKSVNGFATNSLFFYADRTSEPYQGFNKGRNWNMRNRDIDAIIRDVPSVQDISPILWGSRSEKNIVYGIMTGTFNVKGIYPAYFNIDTQDLYYGRLLNEIDMREKRKVCLIGTKINEVLFHNEDPCGKYIRVNGLYYQVVGVVNQRASGLNLGGRGEETVFIPFNTMQQTLNQGDILHFLALSVKPGYPIETTIEQVKNIMKTQNQIAPTDPQAIGVVNIAAQFKTFNLLFTGIDILVWLVGMGTLLSGIIGISNIMMVTVILLSLQKVHFYHQQVIWLMEIIRQHLIFINMKRVFLLDLLDKILSANPTNDPTLLNPGVNIQTAVAAAVVLLISGFMAGLIPAWRAMQIKAIDAIRDE